MPRVARAVVEKIPHHITQRGNRGNKVFFREKDYRQYLEWLGEYGRKSGLEIYAYCLMTNHVHIVGVPRDEQALAAALRPLHMRYAQWINRQRRWSGHLWQGRFFSSALDESCLYAAVRYVERNPVRAGIVEVAEDYDWSSASAHCGTREDDLLSGSLPEKWGIKDWSEWLREEKGRDKVEMLRRNTRKGLPCGSERFVAGLEKLLKRHLRFRPPWRPKKVRETDK